MTSKGFLVVVSSPSGGGKTTIIKNVLKAANGNFRYSISVTTRPQRPGEIDGRDYYFLSLEEFNRKRKNGEFVESAEVHGNWYATPRRPLEKWLDEDRIVFLDLDVKGGLEVKRCFEKKALLIFIKPPSVESLIDRLRNRKTETEAEIKKRLQRVPEELLKSEGYDHLIINEDLEQTTRKVLQIISKHNE